MTDKEFRCKSCNRLHKNPARKVGTRYICQSCDKGRQAALKAIRERRA